MPIPAVVIAGALAGAGSLAAAKLQSNAASNAANTQVNAANNALNLQRQIYGQQQQNLAPYLGIGQTAGQNLLKYLQGPGAIGATPVPGAARFLGNVPGAYPNTGMGGGGGGSNPTLASYALPSGGGFSGQLPTGGPTNPYMGGGFTSPYTSGGSPTIPTLPSSSGMSGPWPNLSSYGSLTGGV